MEISPVDIMNCLEPITEQCSQFVAGFNMSTALMVYLTAALAPITAAINIAHMVGNDG